MYDGIRVASEVVALEQAGTGWREAVALGPGIRFPRFSKPPAPSKPARAPKTDSPKAQAPSTWSPSEVARELFDISMRRVRHHL